MKWLSLLLFSTVVAGCAITSETALIVGQARAPIPVEQVKLYTSAPAKYEEIAIVSADANHAFMNKQDLLDISVANIKAQAAKVGANGVLLDTVGDSGSSMSGMFIPPAKKGGVGVFASSGASTGRAISGRAIYVTP